MNESRIRIRNITGVSRCGHCDNGLAIVSRRKVRHVLVDEHGPCPWCEKGARIEFPEKIKPHWGADGYWRGAPPEVHPQPKDDGVTLSFAENQLRWRLMLARYAGNPSAQPDVGVDIRDPQKRMELLRSHAAKFSLPNAVGMERNAKEAA